MESFLRPLQIQFQEKNVRLVADVPADLPPLTADEQQLSWVITNLVTNALKYTPGGRDGDVSGGGTNGGALRLEVQDTGVGIPQEYLRTDLRQVRAGQAGVGHHARERRARAGHCEGDRGDVRRQDLGGERTGQGKYLRLSCCRCAPHGCTAAAAGGIA